MGEVKLIVQGGLSCPLKEELDEEAWCGGVPAKLTIHPGFRQGYKPEFCPLRSGVVTVALSPAGEAT